MFQFYLDGHSMQVIELDGVDVEPFPVAHLSVSVAQRYSVLVTALNATDANYAIHANMDPAMFDVVPDDLQLNVTSTIVYAADAPLAPTTTLDEYTMFDEVGLVPVVAEPMVDPDTTIDLNVWFDTYDDGTPRASFNNVTWNMPHTPSILCVGSARAGLTAQHRAVHGQHVAESGRLWAQRLRAQAPGHGGGA